MQSEQVEQGRTFVLRLEHGEIIHETIERFAAQEHIAAASVIVLGGANTGSGLVVGPEDGQARPVKPMQASLSDVHEIAGTGTIFPDESGAPVLHLHLACGRDTVTTTGCSRAGVQTWQLVEAVITELVGATATRRLDPGLGFKVLQI